MNLRPYQERGRSDIFRTWEHHDVIFFQLATGGGKTVIFTEIIREFVMQGKRALLLAHRDELISQAWKTLFRSNIYAGIVQGDVSAIEHNGKTYAVKDLRHPCQVSSVQTLVRRKVMPPADVIVIDEGHHTTEGNSYGQILAKYPGAKIIIVSATPYRLSGEGFRHLVPGKETQLITNSTLSDLIEGGWLVPLRLFASHVPDMSDVDMTRGEYDEEQTAKKMELAPVVESYLKDAAGLQGLSFAVNVNHSITLTRQYWQQGVPAAHVDANTKPDDRRKIISDFAAGLIKVVTNVGIFIEGTDFPRCDFVQLARPTKSLSTYLQMVGRGTRPLPGLVDPIDTAAGRRAAIAASAKPDCRVLDCGGLFKEHFLPDFNHDWEYYFNGRTKGTRNEKEIDEDLEMLVYVAEDETGKRVRTNNPKEIEGMQLVEITREVRRQMVNIKALKQFDNLLQTLSGGRVKAWGAAAVLRYVDYCEKHRILMVPEMWAYMQQKVVTDPAAKGRQLHEARKGSGAVAVPEHVFEATMRDLAAGAVTQLWLLQQQDKYFKRNHAQMVMYFQAHNDKSNVTL